MNNIKSVSRQNLRVKTRVKTSYLFNISTIKFFISSLIFLMLFSFVYVYQYKSALEMNYMIYEANKVNKSMDARLQQLEKEVNHKISYVNIESEAIKLGLIYPSK